MRKADHEESITFREALDAIYYMKKYGSIKYPNLSIDDWLQNVLDVLCAVEE